MSWSRINELAYLISQLVTKRGDLRSRKGGLEGLLPAAGNVQEKINEAVISANSRLHALEAYGMSGALLEDIIAPVRNAPDCSGVVSSVQKGIADTDEELADTQRSINNACWEKSRLEEEMAQV